jgi:hypothetical protein
MDTTTLLLIVIVVLFSVVVGSMGEDAGGNTRRTNDLKLWRYQVRKIPRSGDRLFSCERQANGGRWPS